MQDTDVSTWPMLLRAPSTTMPYRQTSIEKSMVDTSTPAHRWVWKSKIVSRRQGYRSPRRDRFAASPFREVDEGRATASAQKGRRKLPLQIGEAPKTTSTPINLVNLSVEQLRALSLRLDSLIEEHEQRAGQVTRLEGDVPLLNISMETKELLKDAQSMYLTTDTKKHCIIHKFERLCGQNQRLANKDDESIIVDVNTCKPHSKFCDQRLKSQQGVVPINSMQRDAVTSSRQGPGLVGCIQRVKDQQKTRNRSYVPLRSSLGVRRSQYQHPLSLPLRYQDRSKSRPRSAYIRRPLRHAPSFIAHNFSRHSKSSAEQRMRPKSAKCRRQRRRRRRREAHTNDVLYEIPSIINGLDKISRRKRANSSAQHLTKSLVRRFRKLKLRECHPCGKRSRITQRDRTIKPERIQKGIFKESGYKDTEGRRNRDEQGGEANETFPSQEETSKKSTNSIRLLRLRRMQREIVDIYNELGDVARVFDENPLNSMVEKETIMKEEDFPNQRWHSAVRLQSVFRCRAERHFYLAKRSAALFLQQWMRNYISRKDTLNAQYDRAAIIIQANWRARCAREEMINRRCEALKAREIAERQRVEADRRRIAKQEEKNKIWAEKRKLMAAATRTKYKARRNMKQTSVEITPEAGNESPDAASGKQTRNRTHSEERRHGMKDNDLVSGRESHLLEPDNPSVDAPSVENLKGESRGEKKIHLILDQNVSPSKSPLRNIMDIFERRTSIAITLQSWWRTRLAITLMNALRDEHATMMASFHSPDRTTLLAIKSPSKPLVLSPWWSKHSGDDFGTEDECSDEDHGRRAADNNRELLLNSRTIEPDRRECGASSKELKEWPKMQHVCPRETTKGNDVPRMQTREECNCQEGWHERNYMDVNRRFKQPQTEHCVDKKYNIPNVLADKHEKRTPPISGENEEVIERKERYLNKGQDSTTKYDREGKEKIDVENTTGDYVRREDEAQVQFVENQDDEDARGGNEEENEGWNEEGKGFKETEPGNINRENLDIFTGGGDKEEKMHGDEYSFSVNRQFDAAYAWVEMQDDDSGHVYYYNSILEVSQWEIPESWNQNTMYQKNESDNDGVVKYCTTARDKSEHTEGTV